MQTSLSKRNSGIEVLKILAIVLIVTSHVVQTVGTKGNAIFFVCSAWFLLEKDRVDKKSVKRLDTYFQLCPDKWPDAIYIESLYTEFAAHYEKLGYEATVLDSGAVLLKRK